MMDRVIIVTAAKADVFKAFAQGRRRTSGNYKSTGDEFVMFGHTVAWWDGDDVRITDAGWGHTATTRAAIDGLIYELGQPWRLWTLHGKLFVGKVPYRDEGQFEWPGTVVIKPDGTITKEDGNPLDPGDPKEHERTYRRERYKTRVTEEKAGRFADRIVKRYIEYQTDDFPMEDIIERYVHPIQVVIVEAMIRDLLERAKGPGIGKATVIGVSERDGNYRIEYVDERGTEGHVMYPPEEIADLDVAALSEKISEKREVNVGHFETLVRIYILDVFMAEKAAVTASGAPNPLRMTKDYLERVKKDKQHPDPYYEQSSKNRIPPTMLELSDEELVDNQQQHDYERTFQTRMMSLAGPLSMRERMGRVR